MSEANPYTAPDADLGGGSDELYEPRIFSFQGRIGRLRYLAYGFGVGMALMVLMVPVIGASALMGGDPSDMGIVSMLIVGLLYLATIVVSIMFAKRRLNDLNRSGWWCLLFLVPLVNLAITIYILFFPGTDGSNNFGPAPVANSTGVVILAWILLGLPILGIVAAIVIPMVAG
ncbi:MAG: DUF805 domain-containing protein [Pseudomonadota bacterium]